MFLFWIEIGVGCSVFIFLKELILIWSYKLDKFFLFFCWYLLGYFVRIIERKLEFILNLCFSIEYIISFYIFVFVKIIS